MLTQIVQRVYDNIAEREAKGIDQKETRYIIDKILGINQIDERLRPENNSGDGGSMYNN